MTAIPTVRKSIELFRFVDFKTRYYTRYTASLQFRDRILGGIPVSAKLIEYWLEKKHMSDQEKKDLQARIKKGEAEEDVEDKKLTSMTAFERDHEENLVVMNANFKACLREALSGLGYFKLRDTKVSDPKKLLEHPQCVAGGTNTFREYSNVEPRFSILLIGGKPVKFKAEEENEHHGIVELVKHFTDKRGNAISALGAHEFLVRPSMTWVFEVPRISCFTEEHIVNMFSKCGDIGLGSNRGMGFGKFDIVGLTKEEMEEKGEKD